MKLQNPTLKAYLEYVENTESPRIFHVWSFLSGISACLGRRCWFEFGIGPIYPNMYILLVGPPGVRKSSAMGPVQKLLRKFSGVRFAPSDTGGQRQGLLRAVINEPLDEEEKESWKAVAEDAMAMSVGNIGAETLANLRLNLNPVDAHALYVLASEFNTFIGKNNLEMITFLGKMYDCEPYDYVLKGSQMTIEDPLMGILGGTTPTNIASHMPIEAVGQGFTSRILLVFADKKYRSIPRPSPMDAELFEQLGFVVATASRDMVGPFEETPEARDFLDAQYEVGGNVNDSRFVYYLDRRHTHLIKVTMAMAAARMSQKIERMDVEDALTLLTETELRMPDALGEYGMNPLSKSKQVMLDYLRMCKTPVPVTMLYPLMSKDMTQKDFAGALADLENAGKIMSVQLPRMGTAYIYKRPKTEDLETTVQHLAAGE